MTNRDTCANCRFSVWWIRYDGQYRSRRWDCRRYPESKTAGVYYWCGEWQAGEDRRGLPDSWHVSQEKPT
jgi:hypothetical protein